MAHYDLGADLLAYILRRAGELLTSADTSSPDIANVDYLIDAKRYLNQAYLEICGLKSWRWARATKQFVSIAPITGSAVIAGATVTLSATIATSVAGRKFYMQADGIPHRIIAHTAGGDILTLETPYTGPTTSGGSVIFQDEIPVATDILAFPTIKELHTGDYLTLIPEGEFNEKFPRNVLASPRAWYAAFIDEGTLRIGPWTTDVRLFECAYNRRPALLTFDGVVGTDTPILPTDARVVIGDRALEKLYADKRDARLTQAQQNVADTLARLSATEITYAKPRIFVPPNQSVGGGRRRF